MIYLTAKFDTQLFQEQGHVEMTNGRMSLRHLIAKWPMTVLENFEVQADETELEILLAHFQNLPRCNNRVQRWHGEFARFIVNNLP